MFIHQPMPIRCRYLLFMNYYECTLSTRIQYTSRSRYAYYVFTCTYRYNIHGKWAGGEEINIDSTSFIHPYWCLGSPNNMNTNCGLPISAELPIESATVTICRCAQLHGRPMARIRIPAEARVTGYMLSLRAQFFEQTDITYVCSELLNLMCAST